MAETIKCVHCDAPLRLPEQYIGQEVRCPSCQKTFTARLPKEPPPRSRPEPEPEPESEPEPRETSSAARRRPREIDEDDAPSGRRRPRTEDDEDYPRPRGSRYDDDRRRRSYPKGERSGIILALGIISLASSPMGCCFFPLAVVGIGCGATAIFLGRSDLAEIASGQRNPAGQGMTNAGMICGIIGTIVSVLFMFISCFGFVMGMANN